MTCKAGLCQRKTPERYDYCDDHHLLRDRSRDDPGTMDSLENTRSRIGGRK